jgi:hypothetical protein
MPQSEWVDVPLDKHDESDWVDVPHEEKTNPLLSAVRQGVQGASGGFSDELAGLVEAGGAAAGLKGLGVGDIRDVSTTDEGPTLDWEVLKHAYNKARNQERKDLEKDTKDNPGVSLAANIGGSIVSPINKITKGMSLAKGGAAIGGIYGLGGSDADNLADLAKDTAIGGAIGGTIGKVADVASPYIEKGVTAVGNAAKSGAERFGARALGAERGTIKSMGQDKVQQLGRYALDEGLLTPLGSTDDIISRNAAKQAEGAGKMNSVYSQIDEAGASTFNPLEVAGKVDEKIGGFYRSPINKGETAQLENTLESILTRGADNIPLTEAQVLKEELGKVANWKNSLNITDKEKMARDAYGIVNKAIDDAAQSGAEKIGVEGLKETLQQGKSLYGSSKGAEQLLENKLAREQGNKLIGLTDWGVLGAGGAATAMTGGAAAIPTLALYGAKKGAEKYGAQIGALSLDAFSKKLLASPQMLNLYQKSPAAFQNMAQKLYDQIPKSADQGSQNFNQTHNKEAMIQKTQGTKYQQVLANAAQKGDASFAAAHYVLANRDPKYRELIDNKQGEK